MTDRRTELLQKAIAALTPSEREELLAELLPGAVLSQAVEMRGPDDPAVPGLIRMPPSIEHGTGVEAARRDRVRQLFGRPTLDRASVGDLAAEPETELKVLPVRLPVADYDRLRAFSRDHGFSMAVIIRTLVERFLDERGDRPPAARA